MKKYLADELRIKILYTIYSFVWGLLVAGVTVYIIQPVPKPFRGFFGVVIFLLGYTSLDIQVKGERVHD